MKLNTSNAESSKITLSSALKRFSFAVVIFLLFILFITIFQPQKIHQTIVSLESRWGNDFYSFDRGIAEKWSIAIGNYLRDIDREIENIPELVIDVPFRGMSKIFAKREEALQIGNLIQGPDDFVKGNIRFKDRTLPIKLRLKGDWNDHLGGRKWSFRIHVRNDEQLLGMRKFSIQSPATRGFQSEMLIFEIMRRFGVMTPRYRFVNVVLNGDSMGIMALEEFFAKEMVEFNQRREGVIVRFDESLVWRAKDSLSGESVGWYGAFDHYTNTAIDAFGSGKIAESPVLSKQYEIAVGMLRGFIDDRLSASEVFDSELIGRYLAIADIFGAWHISRWPNLRFYLNPVSLKLEPIAFDANLQNHWVDNRSIVNDEPIVAKWMRDPKILSAYRETLFRLEDIIQSGELISDLRAKEEQPLRILQTEYRMLSSFNLDYLAKRTDELINTLDANEGWHENHINWIAEEKLYPILAHLIQYQIKDQKWLEISNAIPKDVEIFAIEWVDTITQERSKILKDNFPISLSPRGIGSKPQRYLVELPKLAEKDDGYLEAMVRINQRPWYKFQRVRSSFPAREVSPIPNSTLEIQLKKHKFLSFNDDSQVLTVSKGDWVVSENIIVPPDLEFHVSAGAKLQFSSNAVLVSYSPIFVQGTKDLPVEMIASTDSGWPGIAVLGAEGKSQLNYLKVRDTNSVSLPGWFLTGGINFYQSDVVIEHCYFFDSRGEDALNIISSDFILRDSEIRRTASDAFDADFTTGKVLRSLFSDIGRAGGGDAFDVSGSEITVNQTFFENISDKALSIGERSTVNASDLNVKSAGTAIAAKDDSDLNLTDSNFQDIRFAGIAAYIKKPEYGPARIKASNVRIDSAKEPILSQTGSLISLDGVVVENTDVNVDELYQTIMKPGLR
ncbi:MAG: CotH kinase family protein [Pseudomonadota bacterium]|nr:CotH kinase family protein [Pseudomonadota bacterium]